MSQCILCVAQDNSSSSSVVKRCQKFGHPCLKGNSCILPKVQQEEIRQCTQILHSAGLAYAPMGEAQVYIPTADFKLSSNRWSYPVSQQKCCLRTPLTQPSKTSLPVIVNSNQKLNLCIIFESLSTRTENKERIWKLPQEGNKSK